MTAKPRKHRNTPRITATERVDAYVRAYRPPGTIGFKEFGYLVRMLQAHARETLARERRRNRAGR